MLAPTNNLFLSPDPLNHELGFILYGSQGVLAEKLTEWSVYVHGRLHDQIVKDVKNGDISYCESYCYYSSRHYELSIQSSTITIHFDFFYDHGSFLHHKSTFAQMNYDRWANVLKLYPRVFNRNVYLSQEVKSSNVFSKILAAPRDKRLDKSE